MFIPATCRHLHRQSHTLEKAGEVDQKLPCSHVCDACSQSIPDGRHIHHGRIHAVQLSPTPLFFSSNAEEGRCASPIMCSGASIWIPTSKQQKRFHKKEYNTQQASNNQDAEMPHMTSTWKIAQMICMGNPTARHKHSLGTRTRKDFSANPA